MASALGPRVKQITYGKQGQPENGADEINIVTNAVSGSPAHRRKQLERFAHMSKHDYDQASGAEDLNERGYGLGSRVQGHGPGKQDDDWYQRHQCFHQRHV